jgi:hypothetical protein
VRLSVKLFLAGFALVGLLISLRIVLGPMTLFGASTFVLVANGMPVKLKIVRVTFDGAPLDLKGQDNLAPFSGVNKRENVVLLDAGHYYFGGALEVVYRTEGAASDNRVRGDARVGGMSLPSCSIVILGADHSKIECMDESP